jgi:hypothetical protein
MPSPFPGMDPYLEGFLWPDVHHSLASEIRDRVNPQIRPRYVARIEVQVTPDENPAGEIGIMYPDVEIFHGRSHPQPPATPAAGGLLVAERPAVSEATLSIPLSVFEVRIPTVEIRDTANNQLVTSIEILSPVNKREPGLFKYRAKRRRLIEAGVHILEIDLLRRGQRPIVDQRIPASAYRVTLTRAGASMADVWAIQLADRLPVLPVPLRPPDEDARLDLSLALATIYERAGYDLSINYEDAPPPPPLTAEEETVRQSSLEDWRRQG